MPDWEKFELAVTTFCQALAPDATVTHDAMIADVDTGLPRQRDVWIEAQIGGHFPIKILVSCKRYSRKVDAQKLDAFIGELLSSGAHKGVIYSLMGFTRGALAKAKKKEITCCVLLANQPPPIPDVITVVAYYLDERIRLIARGINGPADWKEMLNANGEFEGEEMPAYRALARLFAADGQAPHDAFSVQPTPVRQSVLTLREDNEAEALQLGVRCEWAIYRARTEAWLVNGSYSFTEGEFKGGFSSPCIDTWSFEPGPGWERIDEEHVAAGNTIKFYRRVGDIEPPLAAIASGDSPVPTTSR